MSPTSIAAYLVLFVLAGGSFLFINLLVGKFLRPDAPNREKLEVYECGEPTIGSSFVQFDLRFYVIALLFIIFDVEVAFFFPWATVFGKATHLMDPAFNKVQSVAVAGGTNQVVLKDEARQVFRELGDLNPSAPLPNASEAENNAAIERASRGLALTAMVDIAVFFAVLMVGFAYVWRRGDLDWVHAMTRRHAREPQTPYNPIAMREPATV